ncbi:Uncharacterised protein [Mycobacteroides abscessus subsp. abscessus]|uniref:hypothetical protein n=1 Tax=Mycobacteroides abscessus TaxID=36809 RepID=UPI000928FF66|nr:hypothetical protein [Mycobacteroides abscessus]SIH33637.1 Uncharacterised protein [Mycobacteroides abscessus subsp. abscessus]
MTIESAGTLIEGARRVRDAVGAWERAVDADDEDVDSLAEMKDAAADLADLILGPM